MNIRLHRFCLLLLLFFSFSSILNAEDSSEVEEDYMTIDVSLKSGFMNGLIREYVFSPTTIYYYEEGKQISEFIKDFKMSELDWEIKNLPVLNFSSDFDILKYVYTGFTASIGIPGFYGNMQDYDWLNSFPLSGGDSSWIYDDPYETTNYSCHDNKLDKYINFSFFLGGNIKLPKDIKISLFAGYHFDYFCFTGYDGYTIYKSEDFEQKDMEKGRVISYRVDTNTLLFGLKTVVDSIPRTRISAGLYVSPGMASLNAFDFHYRNNSKYGTAFWDKSEGAWQIQADLSIQYKFNYHHKLGLYGNLYYVPTSKSTTFTKWLAKSGLPENGSWSQFTDGSAGGIDRFTWTISLNYSFLL